MPEAPLREYLVLVSRRWGKNIAGPIVASLSIILTIVNVSIDASHTQTISFAIAPLLLAALFIWPAQYQVWKAQREAYATEREKNARPELHGTLYRFSATSDYRAAGPGSSRALISFSCFVSVSNRRPVHTCLQDLFFDTSSLGLSAKVIDLSITDPDNEESMQPVSVDQGDLVIVRVDACMSFEGAVSEMSQTVDLTTLRVSGEDSFGGRHSFSMIDGATLARPS